MDKEWHACTRKKKYNTTLQAEKAVKRLRKKGLIIDGHNIYKCQYCDDYHLGHKRR